MRSLEAEVVLESAKLQRKEIKLNGKFKHSPFFLINPQSRADLDIICENVYKSTDENNLISCLGGLLLRIFEHDRVMLETRNSAQQYKFGSGGGIESSDPAFKYIESLLKIVDPCMDLFRNRYSIPINSYKKIEGIPPYVELYFDKILRIKKGRGQNEILEKDHITFWRELFEPKAGLDRKERQKIPHLIKWFEKIEINLMGADIFLPPSPYVTYSSRDYLLDRAIDVNRDSQEWVDGDVATLFNFNSNLFKCRKSILKILEYISKNPTKTQFTVFKITELEKLTNFALGEYGLRNFEYFLQTIRDMRIIEEKENKAHVFGLINGGGFGYCLLGAGFDFFADPVGHYEYYVPGLPRPTHRSSVNPRTLKPESFEGIENLLLDYDVEPLSYHPAKKYRNVKKINRQELNPNEWSHDVRSHHITMWNDFTKQLIENMNDSNKFDSVFYDRVQNSAFSALSPIIRRLTE